MDIDNMEAEDLREELKSHGIELHHKTGVAKLRSTLQSVLDGTYQENEEVETKDKVETTEEVTVEVKSTKEVAPKKLTREQEAMKLVRIVVSPNDPVKAALPGGIFTVCSSKINKGRAIKKYVPFNNDEGWHVPNAIYKQIDNAQMQKFKKVKLPNGDTAMEPYIAKMYNVQVLPPLTEKEVADLAAAQKSRGNT